MTKMTIVTDSNGKLVGAVSGHALTSKHGDVEAQVSFASGRKLHRVEVDDDITRIIDAAAFHDRLLKYVPKA